MEIVAVVGSRWSRNAGVEEIADVGFVHEVLEVKSGVLELELMLSWPVKSWK
jgi:hypothetical protein